MAPSAVKSISIPERLKIVKDQVDFFKNKKYSLTLKADIEIKMMQMEEQLRKASSLNNPYHPADVPDSLIDALEQGIIEINDAIILDSINNVSKAGSRLWALEGDFITHFSPQVCEKLTEQVSNIRGLSLKGNRQLLSLPKELFEKIDRLEILNVVGTGLNSLPVNIISLPLKEMYINRTEIQLAPPVVEELYEKGCTIHATVQGRGMRLVCGN